MISGSDIFPELVTVTFSGHPILHADTPDPTTLIYPLKVRCKVP